MTNTKPSSELNMTFSFRHLTNFFVTRFRSLGLGEDTGNFEFSSGVAISLKIPFAWEEKLIRSQYPNERIDSTTVRSVVEWLAGAAGHSGPGEPLTTLLFTN